MKASVYPVTETSFNEQFADLLGTLYSNDAEYDFFYHEYEDAYTYSRTTDAITFIPIVVRDATTVFGHIALLCDSNLPPGQAFFGFLETVSDDTIFTLLWDELKKEAKKLNITTVLGPVQGSIWHQYRCIKSTSDIPYIKTEPHTPLYYYDLLQSQTPTKEITYSSGLRHTFDSVLNDLHYTPETEAAFSAAGFSITEQPAITSEQLQDIIYISQAAFTTKSWGYTPLSRQTFSKLYTIEKINKHLSVIYLLYHQNKLIGYCSVLHIKAARICKTICILPKFQGMGLGSVLAYTVHSQAKRDGVETLMYALVRDENQVHNFPTEDITVFRRYAAFEFTI